MDRSREVSSARMRTPILAASIFVFFESDRPDRAGERTAYAVSIALEIVALGGTNAAGNGTGSAITRSRCWR